LKRNDYFSAHKGSKANFFETKGLKGASFMTKIRVLSLIAAVGIILSSPFHGADCLGAAEVVPIEGAAYNVQLSMGDNLKFFIGKKITATLASGSSFSGKVKEVGDHFLHIEKLDGKDFFDALIKIDSIVAIDAKFRDFSK